MRKMIYIVCLVLLTCMFPFSCLAEEEHEILTSGEYGYYVNEDGKVTIYNWTGEGETLEIPGEIDGRQVTGIGNRAFSYCSSLSSITLPEGVTSIGNSAFIGCSSLSSITLPDSIETMEENPFTLDIINFNISPDHPYLAVIDGVLFSKPDKRLIYFPNTKEGYVVPDGIKSIGIFLYALNCFL